MSSSVRHTIFWLGNFHRYYYIYVKFHRNHALGIDSQSKSEFRIILYPVLKLHLKADVNNFGMGMKSAGKNKTECNNGTIICIHLWLIKWKVKLKGSIKAKDPIRASFGVTPHVVNFLSESSSPK